jgi:phytoene dehydrogenase-like protein
MISTPLFFMKKNIMIIGSGFSSISAACYLAKEGNEVTILEKNNTPGGRARQFKKDGFTFDIGPLGSECPMSLRNSLVTLTEK